jgi:hypothetical protein
MDQEGMPFNNKDISLTYEVYNSPSNSSRKVIIMELNEDGEYLFEIEERVVNFKINIIINEISSIYNKLVLEKNNFEVNFYFHKKEKLITIKSESDNFSSSFQLIK